MTEPTKSEEMASEATAPVRKPHGSPQLTPFLSLPRRQRAEFLRVLGRISERQESMDFGEDVSVTDGAEVYEMLADFEDALQTVAVDTDKYDAWVAKASDNALGDLLTWYMERFQPGEAKSSSN